MTLRLAAIIAAVAVLLTLGGIVYVQTQRLESTQRQLTETRSVLDATRKAVAELERNASDKSRVETLATGGREAIRATPVDDHEQMAPVLLQGLRIADEIGAAQ